MRHFNSMKIDKGFEKGDIVGLIVKDPIKGIVGEVVDYNQVTGQSEILFYSEKFVNELKQKL